MWSLVRSIMLFLLSPLQYIVYEIENSRYPLLITDKPHVPSFFRSKTDPKIVFDPITQCWPYEVQMGHFLYHHFCAQSLSGCSPETNHIIYEKYPRGLVGVWQKGVERIAGFPGLARGKLSCVDAYAFLRAHGYFEPVEVRVSNLSLAYEIIVFWLVFSLLVASSWYKRWRRNSLSWVEVTPLTPEPERNEAANSEKSLASEEETRYSPLDAIWEELEKSLANFPAFKGTGRSPVTDDFPFLEGTSDSFTFSPISEGKNLRIGLKYVKPVPKTSKTISSYLNQLPKVPTKQERGVMETPFYGKTAVTNIISSVELSKYHKRDYDSYCMKRSSLTSRSFLGQKRPAYLQDSQESLPSLGELWSELEKAGVDDTPEGNQCLKLYESWGPHEIVYSPPNDGAPELASKFSDELSGGKVEEIAPLREKWIALSAPPRLLSSISYPTMKFPREKAPPERENLRLEEELCLESPLGTASIFSPPSLSSRKIRSPAIPEISSPVESFLLCNPPYVNQYLETVYGKDPVAALESSWYVSETKDGLNHTIDSLLAHLGEKDKNWEMLSGDLEKMLCLLKRKDTDPKITQRLITLIEQNIDTIVAVTSTGRPSFLKKAILFVQDVVIYSGNGELSSQSFTKLCHSLFHLHRLLKNRLIFKMATKSLCLMVASVSFVDFMYYFERLFHGSLLSKTSLERSAALQVLKFVVCHHRGYLKADMGKLVDSFIIQLRPYIPRLSSDVQVSVRTEIVELYLILLKLVPQPVSLAVFYNLLTDAWKRRIRDPEKA
ncbi:hypothetical protein BABINDRAFT_161381, partial [Babjeviella inositovora NRRL Y-12698]